MAVQYVEREGAALEAALTPGGDFQDGEFESALHNFGNDAEVEALLKKLINPNVAPGPMLETRIRAMEREKNGGFPCWMYHPTLKPREVINASQQQALLDGGFSRNYVHHAFPQHIYRRNFAAKFELADPMTGAPGEFVEVRLVKSAAEKDKFMRAQAQANCGRWVNNFVDVEYPKQVPRTDGKIVTVHTREQEDKVLDYTEDPAVTIARLEGQLEEAKRKANKKDAA